MRKKLLFFALSALFLGGGGGNYSFGQTLKEKYHNGTSYVFDGIDKITQTNIFTIYGNELGLGEHDEMLQTNNIVSRDGKFTTKYVQYHKGYPVQGAMINLIGDKGIVKYANGFIVENLDINIESLISEDDAIINAIEFVDADEYIWEVTEFEEDYEDLYDFYPRDLELIIIKKRGEEYDHTAENYQLCYKITIHSTIPSSIIDVYINANTGYVFTFDDAIFGDQTATGQVQTWYNGYHTNITTRTRSNSSDKYWLHDRERNIFTTKYGKSFTRTGSYNKIRGNLWIASNIKTAATAHWSIGMAWDYYRDRHGRSGSNYAGKYVHIHTNTPNLDSRNAGYREFNGRDNIVIRPDNNHSAAMLDVLAHEYTHAMIYASSNLGSNNEFDARSLSEGYSDIFGMRIEGYTLGSYDWTFAENMGTYQRNFENPNTDFGMYHTNNGDNPGGSAAYYQQPGYWSTQNFHANGGVLRKWFYLLSNGGTFNGNTVLPLGIETSTDIAYITFNWWLWSNVNYPQMAIQTVEATIAHYGLCSNEHKQVVKALRAVNFDIPNPFCYRIDINGPDVIDIGNVNMSEVFWTANLNDIENNGGFYQWNYPNDWQVSIKNNQLSLISYSSTASQPLSVTYTDSKGTPYSDTIIVHFSDEDWEMTEDNSSHTINSVLSNINTSNSFTISPNPSSDIITLNFDYLDEEVKIEIYNLNGRLISTHYSKDPKFSIDISSYSSGLYLIKAIIGDKVFNEKLSILK